MSFDDRDSLESDGTQTKNEFELIKPKKRAVSICMAMSFFKVDFGLAANQTSKKRAMSERKRWQAANEN